MEQDKVPLQSKEQACCQHVSLLGGTLSEDTHSRISCVHSYTPYTVLFLDLGFKEK